MCVGGWGGPPTACYPSATTNTTRPSSSISTSRREGCRWVSSAPRFMAIPGPTIASKPRPRKRHQFFEPAHLVGAGVNQPVLNTAAMPVCLFACNTTAHFTKSSFQMSLMTTLEQAKAAVSGSMGDRLAYARQLESTLVAHAQRLVPLAYRRLGHAGNHQTLGVMVSVC